MTLNLDNLDYKLPDKRIAKYPLEKREDAKLLCLNKIDSGITHTKIKFLPNILKQNDLIVFNNTKVNNWRFHGNLTTGGRVETLLYERKSETTFLALLSANRKIKENEIQLRGIFWENSPKRIVLRLFLTRKLKYPTIRIKLIL